LHAEDFLDARSDRSEEGENLLVAPDVNAKPTSS